MNDNKYLKETRQRPVVIVLADKVASEELVEIFGAIETSSLVVAGRTIAEHVLMELRDLCFEQCIILAGDNAECVQRMVLHNGGWGMTTNVMSYARRTEDVLREFKSLSDESGLLVIEADRLRGHCLENFLDTARHSEYSLLEAFNDLGSLGITLLKPTKADFIINAMPIVMESVRVNALTNAPDFHRANFDIVSGKYEGLEPSVMINSLYGRRQHWSSHVSNGVCGNWHEVMIDERCQVGRQAHLNSVILNHDVYVEDRACLDNTVVMSNSSISASQPIENAIIHNGSVFQL